MDDTELKEVREKEFKELTACWQSKTGKSSNFSFSASQLADFLANLPDNEDKLYFSLVSVKNREPHQPTHRIFWVKEV